MYVSSYRSHLEITDKKYCRLANRIECTIRRGWGMELIHVMSRWIYYIYAVKHV